MMRKIQIAYMAAFVLPILFLLMAPLFLFPDFRREVWNNEFDFDE